MRKILIVALIIVGGAITGDAQDGTKGCLLPPGAAQDGTKGCLLPPGANLKADQIETSKGGPRPLSWSGTSS
jgi:hypothetical protein